MSASLLSAHMEQISMCATSIAELDFGGGKMFTNAMLARRDITTLIRDTELHERALFSIAPTTMLSSRAAGLGGGPTSVPAAASASAMNAPSTASRRHPPKRNTAVAAVLGRDLFRRVREADDKATGSGGSGPTAQTKPSRERGGATVDVEVLLEGAARLCEVYPMPGAVEEIAGLRARFELLSAGIAHYEDRTARNTRQLESMSLMRQARVAEGEERDWRFAGNDDDGDDAATADVKAESLALPRFTREDVAREEKEIAELERKKKGLEERVNGMDKDLGGLMR